MQNNPAKYHRRSVRLPGYDYSRPGAYFVTICVQNRDTSFFGSIANGKIILNKFGDFVRDEWLKTVKMRPNIKIDEYVIMPNHFHGILFIVGARRAVPLQKAESFGKPVTGSIPTIIRSFKSAVTKRINENRNTPGQSVWQRDYYEHIIRNEKSMVQIRQYIRSNPANWDNDDENPMCKSPRYVAMPNPQRP